MSGVSFFQFCEVASNHSQEELAKFWLQFTEESIGLYFWLRGTHCPNDDNFWKKILPKCFGHISFTKTIRTSLFYLPPSGKNSTKTLLFVCDSLLSFEHTSLVMVQGPFKKLSYQLGLGIGSQTGVVNTCGDPCWALNLSFDEQ